MRIPVSARCKTTAKRLLSVLAALLTGCASESLGSLGASALTGFGLSLSDFAAWFGWVAIILLTLNFALGILQPLRYDPLVRWPRRRLPASLYKLHKWIGYTALGVVLAHPLFLLAHRTHPFTLSAIYIPFRAPVDPVFAGLGTIAFYAMLFVATTSFFRLAVGLRLWKLLHFVAYAVLPVMLVHGLLIDPDLDANTPIDYFDAGKAIVEGCALVAIMLAAWRLRYHFTVKAAEQPASVDNAVTVAPWRGLLQVASVRTEAPGIRSLTLVNPKGGALPFSFAAGQYVELAGIRPYTIASAPLVNDRFDLTVKAEQDGFFSAVLHQQTHEGDLVDVRGPLGAFIPQKGAEHHVMIAGGVGITPFLAMIPQLLADPLAGRITLVHSIRTPTDRIRADELSRWAAESDRVRVEWVYTREGSGGASRRLTSEILQMRIPDLRHAQVYLCGPDPMMRDVAAMLSSLGVRPEAILAESFGAARASLDVSEITEN
mgnify:CR=1 FL=1